MQGGKANARKDIVATRALKGCATHTQ
eukprot:COSAG01_NODE_47946_length_385_cov_1.496503_1_plen_26_part_01